MTGRAHEVLTRLEDARRQLESIAHRDPVIDACTAGLARMAALLARPPRVVILGEVNSGKTSVADLLLGVSLLPAGVVANTRLPLLISYAETTALYAVGEERRLLSADDIDAVISDMQIRALEIGLPNDILKEFEILDTPAPAEIEDEEIAGDIRIWCTVATRAWTESERVRWSGLPRRNWHNALLVATHRDALESSTDAAKIEWRLRSAAGDMFRDVTLVSATDAARSRRVNGRPSDDSAVALVGQIRVWAAEIRERRASKVEKLARSLARLTFHQLVRAQLKAPEAKILKDWEIDCARLLGRLDDASGDLIEVAREMLHRFAKAMQQTRPDSIGRDGAWSLPSAAAAPRRSTNGPAARRYARLIAADLTALLRGELARLGLRDTALAADYEAAKAALLPLARLDAVFDELGALVVPRKDVDKYGADQDLVAAARV